MACCWLVVGLLACLLVSEVCGALALRSPHFPGGLPSRSRVPQLSAPRSHQSPPAIWQEQIGIGTASEGGQGEGEDGPRHKTLKHEGVSRFTKCCRRCAERCAWPDRRSAECGSRIPLPGSVDPQEGSSGGCNFTCIAISVKFLEISIHVLRFHEIP